MSEMFDMELRALRRDRAARSRGDMFLLDRTFEDCLERIGAFDRMFDRALLLGCPDPGWPLRLGTYARSVEAADPGAGFAARAGARQWFESDAPDGLGPFDLILAIGTLDTVNQLQPALRRLFGLLRAGGLFIGALSGGETLPLLRRIMASVDRASGQASPRIHPRIETAMLAPLLEQAGFVRPVVDIDRVLVAYPSLERLVGDLRAMAATNVLAERSRTPILRSGLAAARAAFAESVSSNGRAEETFEILHFAAFR